MRWLHLTDLHVGQGDNDAQHSALDSLTARVAEELEGCPKVDLVFLTGDLAFSGKAEQYARLREELIEPLRAIPQLQSATFVGVPGNHDLDCDKVLPATWETLGKSRQQKWFSESEAGQKTRLLRTRGFAEYEQFVSTSSIESVLPSTQVSRLLPVGPADLLLTNTALFSDWEVSDQRKAPFPLPSLRASLRGHSSAKPLVVLGHHPLEWFTPHSLRQVQSFLDQHRAVYVHGHEHAPMVTLGTKGLRTLGFGATYQSPQDTRPRSYYRNSFALCTFDGSELSVRITEWSNENGRWVTATDLPSEFSVESKTLSRATAFRCPWVGASEAPSPQASTSPILQKRSAPIASDLLVLRVPRSEDWESIFSKCPVLTNFPRPNWRMKRLLSDRPQSYSFHYGPEGATAHRVDVVGGPGHVLDSGVLQEANLRLDLENYESLTLLTLGEVSKDARNLGDQLRASKPLRIGGANDLAPMLLRVRTDKLSQKARELDAGEVLIRPVLDGPDVYLLVIERASSEWFEVLSEAGEVLKEGDSVVRRAREFVSSLATTRYRSGRQHHTPGLRQATTRFDTQEYLLKCKATYDSVRYPGVLSSVVPLSQVDLSKLYVATGVEEMQTGVSSANLKQAVSDHLQGIRLDDTLRHQLEGRLQQILSLHQSAKLSNPEEVYRTQGALVLLGDPGAGKTCFVKRQVVTYADDGISGAPSWHSRHVPVLVPLTRLRLELLTGEDPSRALCEEISRVLARQGLDLPASEMLERLGMGTVALFFDGFDEVAPGQRASLLRVVSAFVENWHSYGNRFVITSRPAALQHVDLAPNLPRTRLMGLNQEQKKVLASRILGLREETDGTLEYRTPNQILLDRLLEDLERIPGLNRLADNPLLLTLLTLIYAQGGNAAAKRHRVYADAVSTLVSVRNRELSSRVLSEIDVKRRLAAVALHWLETSRAVIGEREVVGIVQRLLSEEQGKEVESEEAAQFLQDVAESTGLLVRHEGDGPDKSVVTFMHHSFLEYFAAFGLASSPSETRTLSTLIRNPKWQEVITVAGGILAERGQLGSVIASVLDNVHPTEIVTKRPLRLAFDLAFESDVPSEGVESQLLHAVLRGFEDHSLIYDSDFLIELGGKLGYLFAVSGSYAIRDFLASRLEVQEAAPRAAGVYLLSGVAKRLSSFPEAAERHEEFFRKMFTLASSSANEPLVAAALCEFIASARAVRGDTSAAFLRRSLRSSNQVVRFAAVAAIDQAPGLALRVWSDLRGLLRERLGGRRLAGWAARAMLRAGGELSMKEESRTGVAQLLESHQYFWDDIDPSWFEPEREQIAILLESRKVEERVLGVRMLPWLDSDLKLARETVLEIVALALSEPSGVPKVVLLAAIDVIRVSSAVRESITYREATQISFLLQHSKRDVRTVVARTLGVLGPIKGCLGPLLDYFERTWPELRDKDEFFALVRAISRAGKLDTEAHSLLIDVAEDLLRRLPGDAHVTSKARTLLETLTELPLQPRSDLAKLLRRFATNQRHDQACRDAAFLLHYNVAVVSRPTVSCLVGDLLASRHGQRHLLPRAVTILLASSRRDLDTLPEIVVGLPELQEAILFAFNRRLIAVGVSASREQGWAGEYRRALQDVEALRYSFSEVGDIQDREEEARGLRG